MKNFLFQYGWIILVVIGFAGLTYWKYNKNLKAKGKEYANDELFKDLREATYQLMFLAEKAFGKESDGAFKFNWVIEGLYKKFPDTLKMILEETELKQTVQEWYDTAKDFLDDGSVNGSTK
jgi:hypothetical protein